jgi:hypothetical protein
VRTSLPADRLLAGIAKVYAPDASVSAEEVYPPPERVTVPVGVVPPDVEAATVTGTLSAVPALRLVEAGVTVTVAVPVPVVVLPPTQPFTTLATLSEPSPVARS